MPVTTPELIKILTLLDSIAGGVQALVASINQLQLISKIDAEVQAVQATSLLNQQILTYLMQRVSANQTQSAANSLVLAQISRQVANIPAPSSIWDVQLTASPVQPDNRAANALLYLYNTLQFINGVTWRRYSSGGIWAWSLQLPQIGYVANPGPQPIGSFDGLRADDTVLTWLEREAPGYDWSYDNYPYFGVHSGYVSSQTAVNGVYWLCLLNDADLDAIKRALGLTTAQNVPPVWPGLANVTLGTQVPITPPTQTLPGPMDGVLVQITAVPTPVGYYQFGPDRSYVKIGGVAFQTDDGYDEEAQPVSFQQHIITPKRQVRAQSALFRWVTGVQGTITPWTIA